MIYLVEDLTTFADAFAERIDPPFNWEDASSEPQRSVLGSVWMAYVNQRQLPITAGSSAESGAALVLERSTESVALFHSLVPESYVGSISLRDKAVDSEYPNPLTIFARENGFDLDVFAYKQAELARYFDEELLKSIESRVRDLPEPVVVAFTLNDPEGVGN